jgi:HSP20 family protein
MDAVLGPLFRHWPWGSFDVETRAWTPAVDMIDRHDEVVMRADLPGLDRMDVELIVAQGVFQLRGERRADAEAPQGNYFCLERWSGRFARTMRLPAGVDPDQMTATVKNGVRRTSRAPAVARFRIVVR